MNTSIHLIAISEAVWRSYPEDRSFAELAKDALAMERLMAKEVDPRTQQLRYIQMSRRLQSLAMQCILNNRVSEYLTWKNQEADVYLMLLRNLQALEKNGNLTSYTQNNTINDSYIPRTTNFCGKCFYQPGSDIATQSNLFSRLKMRNEDVVIIARQKGDFYKKAHQQNAAVIEVVTFS
ncbi:MAG: hypothetical protein F6J86_09165 [Symploca sp. SIO1B1]|nr:hypothetical protein [Symploca sp. SIO1B1]